MDENQKKRLFILLFVGLPLCLCCCISAVLGTGTLGLAVAHDTDPKTFEKEVSKFIGRTAVRQFDFKLDLKSIEKAEELGIDPQTLANMIAAIQWIENEYGTQIDLGMMLAIHEGESGGGVNLGDCPGIASAMGNTKLNQTKEANAAKNLLDRFQQYRIRKSNPVAAEYILSDYSDYTGHCSAGEMGAGGFIPTTAWKVCQDGLANHPDKQVQACDYWDDLTREIAKAYWLYAIGYDANLSEEANFEALYGWNQNAEYRQQLLDLAYDFNSTFGETQPGIEESDSKMAEESADTADTEAEEKDPKPTKKALISKKESNWFEELVDWRQLLEIYLVALEMLPEDPYSSSNSFIAQAAGDWIAPTLRNFLSGYDYDSDHTAVDFACITGEEIVAPADGKIVIATRSGWNYDPAGWGHVVWINHGDGIYSGSAHLMEATKLNDGDLVKQGDVVGYCGDTGRAYGSHNHFMVLQKHPDAMITWDDPTAYLDPHDFIDIKQGR